jgi:hypothetical protein
MITINPFHPKVQSQVNRGSGKFAGRERLAQIAAAKRIPRVRVVATRPELVGILQHSNGMRLRSTGSTEWPLDSFTRRRLKDGDIHIVADLSKADLPKEEHKPRQQQHAHQAKRATASSAPQQEASSK